jgi:hypothetical protein
VKYFFGFLMMTFSVFSPEMTLLFLSIFTLFCVNLF